MPTRGVASMVDGKVEIMDGTCEARIDITGVPYSDETIEAADAVTINGFRFVRDRSDAGVSQSSEKDDTVSA